MRDAIRKNLADFLAIVGVVLLGIGVGAYILSNQRLRFPFVEDKPFVVQMELQNAQAVQPGQGQTIRSAGVEIGRIGDVELEEGVAVVEMQLESRYDGYVREDATALLRSKTGLKDMFVELDPGTKSAPLFDEKGVIPVANTAPDIDPDEVLSALDVDTRAYLKLLINGAGKGLEGRDDDLRQVFARLGPLHRDLRRINTEVVKRKRNLARLINNYGQTTERLGKEDRDLSSLVVNADRVFSRLAEEDQNISAAVRRLPSTLRQVESTLVKVGEFGEVARPAFSALRPAVREIDDANAELRPLAEEAEPVLRKKVRPFVARARPYIRDLNPAARDLGRAQPDLRDSFFELNRLFNMAAYNPGGQETLTGNMGQDLQRDEGMLFWLAWASHNSNSLFSTSDAQGPFRRFIALATCSTYKQLILDNGSAGPLVEDMLGVNDLLADSDLCPST